MQDNYGRPATVGPLVIPEIVALPAEIDAASAEQVSDELCSAFRAGVTVVIADLTWTTFCDSSGAQALLLASDKAAANHDELRLVIRDGAVLGAMQVLGLDRLLHIYPTLIAALAA
jgi:anti-anti-sigma factor